VIEDFGQAALLIDTSQIALRVAAAAVGAVAVGLSSAYMIPKIVDGLLPSPEQDGFYSFLPVESLLDDGKTIVFENDHYARVIDLVGADLALASPDQKIAYFHARKRLVDEMERMNVVEVKILHMKDRVSLARQLRPTNPILRTIDDRWEAASPAAYSLSHAVILIAKNRKKSEALANLETAETLTLATMSSFGPKVMMERPDGTGESPLKPLARALSPISKPNPRGLGYSGPLAALLTGDDVDFSQGRHGVIKFHAGAETKYGCVVTWRDCGEKTSETVMREVLSLDCEMVVYHAIQPIQTAKAIIELNRGARAAVTEHLSLNAADEIQEVIRQVEGTVSGEKAALVYYATHIIPVADSIEDLARIVTRIVAIMTQTAGTMVRLKETAQSTFMSMVATDLQWPRKFRFLSTNVASQIVPQRSRVGFTKSDWAEEPVAWFRTVQGDPYPFHFHAHDANQAPAHTVIFGPTGSGKAQPLDAKVLTPNGFRPIGGLRPGDTIMGEDGEAHHVEAVYPQGKKPCFRLYTSDGRSTRACDEHLFAVTTRTSRGQTGKKAILTLAEIKTQHAAGQIVTIPNTAPLSLEGRDDHDAMDGELRTRVRECHVQIGDKTFVAGRYYPLQMLNGPIAKRLDILERFIWRRAFMSPDGVISFSTTDEALIADIIYLVRSLGGIAYLSDGAPVYMNRITFKLPDHLTLRCQSLSQGLHDDRLADISELEITDIEEIEPCEMVCIQTSNPSRLYVTDDFIVTHNTSLMTFLAAQASRIPRLRTFLLDRHNGMKIFTTVSGGRYISFDGDAKTAALNPFHLPDTAENRKFLQRWLRSLANVSDAYSDEEIARVITMSYDMDLPKDSRSIAKLARAAFSPRSEVRRNLEPWIKEDVYGGYFNAQEDNLDLADARIVGFDMTNILNDEKLAPPMVDYLVHRIKTLSIETADPTLVIVDETAPMLRNEKFAKSFLTVGLAEGRKLRQSFNLCFQTPSHLAQTGVEQIVLDQCQKIMFYRNPRDSDQLAAEYDRFGLNAAEIDFIAGRTHRDVKYAVLIKNQLSGESSIVDVNLGRLGPYLGAFESDARQVINLNQLIERHGAEGAIERYFGAR
jgi:type IV secretory pathway VirB4 component